MGEDAMGGYLSNTSTGSEYPVDSIPATDSEVIPTEPGGDTRTADAYTTTHIRDNQYGIRRAIYESSKKKLNERNAELDGKKLYSLPNEVRAFATPDGEHDDIMKRLRSGEQMDLPSLYRLRNELGNSSNTKITGAINSIIKRAQMQGDSLRNVHSNTNTGIEQPKSAIPGKGHRKEGNTKIYYENN